MKAFLHPNRILTSLPGAFLHDQDPKLTSGAQVLLTSLRISPRLLTANNRDLRDSGIFGLRRTKPCITCKGSLTIHQGVEGS